MKTDMQSRLYAIKRITYKHLTWCETTGSIHCKLISDETLNGAYDFVIAAAFAIHSSHFRCWSIFNIVLYHQNTWWTNMRIVDGANCHFYHVCTSIYIHIYKCSDIMMVEAAERKQSIMHSIIIILWYVVWKKEATTTTHKHHAISFQKPNRTDWTK